MFAPGYQGTKVISRDEDSFDGEKTVVGRLETELRSHPFRVATEASRAMMEVVVGGIGYLL